VEATAQHLGTVLPQAAARFPGKTALIMDGKTFTYADLEARSNRLAGSLVELGVAPGDRVTLYGPNSPEWILSYYAIAKVGAVINPINVMLTPAEVLFVLGDCGAKVLIGASDKVGPVLALEHGLDHAVAWGAGRPEGALAFDDLIGKGPERFAVAPRDPEDLSTIGYTSGTTGHPKGAMLTHRGVHLNSTLTVAMHGRGKDDVFVSALPCGHVYGNVVMNGAFLVGATLVCFAKFDPTATLQAFQAHRATMFDGVPTMYMYMLDEPGLASYDLSSLSRCTVGGQTMPPAKMEAVEAAFGCPLIELWGMTEIAGLGTTFPVEGGRVHGSIGKALPQVECRIAHTEDAAKTLPPGEVGELMVRGPIVMKGYYGNEEATRDTIEPDGWLHTGDLAKTDAEGHIFIVDRKKDMIITAGYNVYPAELERVVAKHPAVALVAVGRAPDELKGEVAKAYVVLKSGATATEQEIRAFCREHLAAYKVPRAVQFVADLPKTSTGKVLRRELHTLDLPPQP